MLVVLFTGAFVRIKALGGRLGGELRGSFEGLGGVVDDAMGLARCFGHYGWAISVLFYAVFWCVAEVEPLLLILACFMMTDCSCDLSFFDGWSLRVAMVVTMPSVPPTCTAGSS